MNRSKRLAIPPRRVLTDPVCLLAFGLGAGLAPKAPGTVGTLFAILLFWPMASLSLSTYLILTLLLFGVGVWLCGECEQRLGIQDHSGIVFDEFVGLLVSLAGVPLAPVPVLAGFLLFRLFDVVKPWPIRWFDRRIHGGFGIMLDDVIAGVFAWLCLFLIRTQGWI